MPETIQTVSQKNPESIWTLSGYFDQMDSANVYFHFYLYGDKFEINSNNGIIRVRDPEVIDYEKNKQFVLTIQGQGLGVEDDLNAFTTCIIKVKNVNDNVPKFTQNMYIARVLEGLPKASLVTTVTAFDLDYEQSNDDITYEIIGGNVDEAFYMTTAQPGVILTNTVLDREIILSKGVSSSTLGT